MKKFPFLVILIFICQITLLTSSPYVQAPGTDETWTVEQKGFQKLKYFVKSVKTASYQFRSYEFDLTSKNFAMIEYEASTTTDCSALSISPNLDCALIHCPTTPPTLNMVKFETAGASAISDLVANIIVADPADTTKKYKLSNLCTAFSIDS